MVGRKKKTHSLGQRSALADCDLVTLLDTESGRDVCGEVLVAALVTGVLGDEVEVLAADDEGTVHLGGNDGAGQDTAADRDLADKGALLVDVVAVNGGLGGLETQTDVLVPSSATLAGAGGLADALGVLEDVRLLLVSALALDGKLGGHDGGCRWSMVELEGVKLSSHAKIKSRGGRRPEALQSCEFRTPAQFASPRFSRCARTTPWQLLQTLADAARQPIGARSSRPTLCFCLSPCCCVASRHPGPRARL